MTGRAARRVAFGVWALTCVIYVLDVLLHVQGGFVDPFAVDPLLQAAEDFVFVLVATLALVALRSQPLNAVGWWLMVAGVSFPLAGFVEGLALYLFDRSGPTAPALLAGWVARWVWLASSINIPFTLLLYPNGRLPSPRWRPVPWLFWAITLAAGLTAALDPGPVEGWPSGLVNPSGVEAFSGLITALGPVIFPTLLSLPLVGAASLVARYRNGDLVVRQQVKLLGWGAGVAVVFFGFNAWAHVSPAVNAVLNILFAGFMAGVVTAGIVRYRLFDIDRLISRTVSYALVVASLAVVYVGGVALLTRVLPFRNHVGVAASTLSAAALFNPLRRRIQVAVDRRFHRLRYDPEALSAALSTRLRSRVDVELVASDWTTVVAEALQPAALGVWLRDGERRDDERLARNDPGTGRSL